MTVEERLADLADQLHSARLRGNKADLEWVLEQARILSKAKQAAKRKFGKWLRKQAHMDHDTADRYMAVAAFVDRNSDDRRKISTLSLAKTYVLEGLNSATARNLLRGEVLLSASIDDLNDIQFRKEVRDRFGRRVQTRRVKIYRAVMAKLNAIRKVLAQGRTRAITAVQKAELLKTCDGVRQMLAGLKEVV